MLSISEEYFRQGLCQAVFFHDIPAEDSQYDIEKNVVEGNIVSLGGGNDEEMKETNGERENATPYNELDTSFEEILEPL